MLQYRLVVLLVVFAGALALAPGPRAVGDDEENAPDIAALIRALEEGDAGEKVAAAHALGELGPKARAAVSALLDALDDENYDVQAFAASALVKIDADPTRLVPALMRLLRDEGEHVRNIAVTTLSQLGDAADPAVPALAEALGDSNRHVRLLAAKALNDLGRKAKPALPELIKALSHSESLIRMYAASTLGQLGETAREALPALLQCWASEDGVLYGGAFSAIHSIGTEGLSAEHLPHFEPLLRHSDRWTRFWALAFLRQIGQEARRLEAPITARLGDDDLGVRAEALGLLAELGMQSEKVVAVATSLLEEAEVEPHARVGAARALGKVREGHVAKRQAALVRALSDPERLVRLNSARAFVDAKELLDGAVPALLKATGDSEDVVRAAAAWALAAMPAHFDMAMARLLPLLRSRASSGLWIAMQAVADIGAAAKDAVPALEALVEDEDEDVRKLAAQALEAIRGE